MIPEVGHFALVIALCLALVQTVVPLAGAARGHAAWMALARPAAAAQCLFLLIAFAALATAFLSNDFSVLYVASNSNSALPAAYRVAAVWGSHEGSLLLWVLILGLWSVAVGLFSRALPAPMTARVLAVMGAVSAGFLLFLLTTSNPFERLLPAAAEGRDLNPLLQDPGLVFHPPMLYMGYVGFSVAFAFAIAALLGGRLDAAWARWSRPWTVVAWTFLTLGIMLGSAWAYYELGWGGWWFWDPVENASFMPWLVGTALIHSLAVTEKRGAFRSWTVLLAIAAFSLSLLGTFLVRSGVLTSVHAFASDPARGLFILVFLVLVIGTSLALFARRAPKVGLGGAFSTVSRESLLLANNVFLAAATFAVMLGTLYPLFIDALGLGKLSVGPPYFETVFVPIMAPVVLLMAPGASARWKHDEPRALARRLRGVFLLAVVVAGGAWLAARTASWPVALGLFLAAWAALGVMEGVRARLRPRGGPPLRARVAAVPASYWGMQLAHLGVAVFVAGVTLVGGLQEERDVRMHVGDTVAVAGYTFRFDGASEVPGPNYVALRGRVTVLRDGRVLRELHPEKRAYLASGQQQTEAAIDTGLLRDLYVSLGDPLEGGAWTLRVFYKPFVDWIWGGCLLMALGGLCVVADRRYRLARRPAPAPSIRPAATEAVAP